jgi:plastocyanin
MSKARFMIGMLFATLLNTYAFAEESQGRRNDSASEVTIAKSGTASEKIVIETLAVAVKETETKDQLSKFGEVYAFTPAFFAVYRDQPTQIELWNLQPDDSHDFTLVGPSHTELMSMALAPLAKRSMVLTFHREGLYRFKCNMHQPEMSGQILVLPPSHKNQP